MPELKFKGKTIIRSHHLTLPYRQMKPVVSKSRNKKPSLDDNLIIHGDNLLALKSLLPSFAGKIKCIYIDPPYNTGNEKWVYNDNVNSPMHQEWLEKVVDREDLTRHDKWLCMMWPRLVLLRELLRADGVIFVSIDDNEAHRLRAVMDEVFGEGNFVATLIWIARSGQGGTVSEIASRHEYILIFARSREMIELKMNVEKKEGGKYEDEQGRYQREQLRQWGQGDRREDRPSMFFPILHGKVKIFPIKADGSEGRWRFGKPRVEKMQIAGDLDFVFENDRWNVYRKLREGRESITAPDSVLDKVGTSANGTLQLKEIFDGEKIFDTAKPVPLIKRLIELATPDSENDIILDSFAGSGTTGQAVLALNAEDGGNRKFILIEQEDYADSITAERIRRVMKGVPNAKDENLQKGYGGSFSYFTLGPALNEDEMLGGKTLPSYLDLARYVFFTATGENLDEAQINSGAYYVGESKNYRVWLYYQPDVEFLKNAPLNKDFAQNVLGEWHAGAKTRLVIGSHKFLDDEYLREHKIEFCQLPFAIYRFRAA